MSIGQLVLSLADNKQLLGLRYAEWATRAPSLEADIAAAAMGLDDIGHSRVLLGCLIVLACATGTSAVFWSGELNTLRDYLSINPSLKVGGALAPTGFGGAQTLLLVGNDQRKHTTTAPVLPHSNEMLLVRLDPSKPYISLMSIPRELQVTIHCPRGRATTRLNYALTCGGVATLVKTINQLTAVQINHVVEIDFNHFKRAIDDMGCVYSTVDITTSTCRAGSSTKRSTSNPATSACAVRPRSSSSPIDTATPRWSATHATRAFCSTPRRSTARRSSTTSTSSSGSSVSRSRPIRVSTPRPGSSTCSAR